MQLLSVSSTVKKAFKLIRRVVDSIFLSLQCQVRSFLFSSLAVSRFDEATSDGFMEKLGRHRAGLVPENWEGKRIYILARFICGPVNLLTVNSVKKGDAKNCAPIIY